MERLGADAWALIETGSATTDDIVRGIRQRYEGDRPEVEQAVVRLIEELRQEGLIVADGTGVVESMAATAGLNYKGAEKHKFEAPVLRKYTDMQDLLLLDLIHKVDVTGWPNPPLTCNAR